MAERPCALEGLEMTWRRLLSRAKIGGDLRHQLRVCQASPLPLTQTLRYWVLGSLLPTLDFG